MKQPAHVNVQMATVGTTAHVSEMHEVQADTLMNCVSHLSKILFPLLYREVFPIHCFVFRVYTVPASFSWSAWILAAG